MFLILGIYNPCQFVCFTLPTQAKVFLANRVLFCLSINIAKQLFTQATHFECFLIFLV